MLKAVFIVNDDTTEFMEKVKKYGEIDLHRSILFINIKSKKVKTTIYGSTLKVWMLDNLKDVAEIEINSKNVVHIDRL